MYLPAYVCNTSGFSDVYEYHASLWKQRYGPLPSFLAVRTVKEEALGVACAWPVGDVFQTLVAYGPRIEEKLDTDARRIRRRGPQKGQRRVREEAQTEKTERRAEFSTETSCEEPLSLPVGGHASLACRAKVKDGDKCKSFCPRRERHCPVRQYNGDEDTSRKSIFFV